MRPAVLAALILLVLPTWVWSDDNAKPEHTTAQASVIAWLELIDQKQYERSWEASAPLFQAALSAKKWALAAQAARQPLGSNLSRELIGAQYRSELPGAPPGDYLIFQFKSSFEKKGDAIETVTPVLVDGRWRVSGYFVR